MKFKKINKLLILFLIFIITLFGCLDLNVQEKTFYIYPEEDSHLDSLSKEDITALLKQSSVGRYQDLGGQKLFVPVNFEATESKVGRYQVTVADLTITSEVNRHNPIRFEREKDEMYFPNGDTNTFLFFCSQYGRPSDKSRKTSQTVSQLFLSRSKRGYRGHNRHSLRL